MGKRIDSQKLRRREQRRNENGGWRTLLACAAEIASMDPWERLGSGDPIAPKRRPDDFFQLCA